MTSEAFIAKAGAEKQGFRIATKNWPSKSRPMGNNWKEYDHSPEGVRACMAESLQALQTDCVDMLYLHAPDRKNPFDATMKALDKEHKKGHFKRLAISNFRADEVEEVMRICTEHGYVKPEAYQGLYNSLVRTAEEELLPVLRKHGIAYYTYNPLAGGLYAGKLQQEKEGEPDPNEAVIEKGSRFDKNTWQGQAYRKRYFHDAYFAALEAIRQAAHKHNLTMNEVALRWCMHHSALSAKHNDHVIFSASSLAHVEQNLVDFEKGPLPDDVVHAVDKGWQSVKASGNAPAYHF